jgi:hypothetical protein
MYSGWIRNVLIGNQLVPAKNGFAGSGISHKRGTAGSVGKGGIGKTITEVGVQRTANLLQH